MGTPGRRQSTEPWHGAAAEWKTLMADDECRGFVVAYVRWFWRSKVNPQAWITGLLKILEKKGDLSMAGNYRGIK
jgi:hypothetical protein